MLELAILGLLQAQELHGYEIRRRLRDDLGLFVNVSFGSLYPALSRLERSGAVEAVGDGPTAAMIPMTGSLSGERAALRNLRNAPRGRRSRKVYRITPEGRRQFAALLDADPPADDARGFGLRLAFARHLPPAARLRLLERRRAQLAERLAVTAGAVDRLDPYARSLAEHTRESTERDISWLDRLITAERSRALAGAVVAEPPPPPGAVDTAAPGRNIDTAAPGRNIDTAAPGRNIDTAAAAARTEGGTA